MKRILILLLFLPFALRAQVDSVLKEEFKHVYYYSADSTKLYINRAETNGASLLGADLKTCTFYWYEVDDLFFTQKEIEHVQEQRLLTGHKFELDPGRYKVVLQPICKTHKLVIIYGDLKVIIEGDSTNYTTGKFTKYFKDRLVTKGSCIEGNLSGFCTFYKYELNDDYTLRYFFPAEKKVKPRELIEQGIRVSAMVMSVLLALLCVVVIYKKWYLRLAPYQYKIFGVILFLNGIVNTVLVYQRHLSRPVGNNVRSQADMIDGIFVLLHLPRMVCRNTFLPVVFATYLWITCIAYTFGKKTPPFIRVCAIILILYNIIFYMLVQEFKGFTKFGG